MTEKINQLVSDVAQLFVQYEHRKVIRAPATPTLEQHGAMDYHTPVYSIPGYVEEAHQVTGDHFPQYDPTPPLFQ